MRKNDIFKMVWRQHLLVLVSFVPIIIILTSILALIDGSLAGYFFDLNLPSFFMGTFGHSYFLVHLLAYTALYAVSSFLLFKRITLYALRGESIFVPLFYITISSLLLLSINFLVEFYIFNMGIDESYLQLIDIEIPFAFGTPLLLAIYSGILMRKLSLSQKTVMTH